MPKLNVDYSGAALITNAVAINRIMEANGIRSVLAIGNSAERTRPIVIGTPDLLYYGQKASAADLEMVKGLTGPYDMVIACNWLSLFPVEQVSPAAQVLKKLCSKVLFVHENETTSGVTTPQRARGWDRVDWIKAVGGSKYRTCVVSMTVSAEGVVKPPSYHIASDGTGIWREIFYA